MANEGLIIFFVCALQKVFKTFFEKSRIGFLKWTQYFLHYYFCFFLLFHNASVIKQKGESQNGCFKKIKHVKFSEKKELFLTPDRLTYVCVSGGMKCSFEYCEKGL